MGFWSWLFGKKKKKDDVVVVPPKPPVVTPPVVVPPVVQPPILNLGGDRVLLVGINKYPGMPLKGCVNDVLFMADLLKSSFGILPEDIVILTDGRATTAAILEKLQWLAATPPGKRAYFHYSGHGAQAPSRTGYELDGLDEVICPVDFDWSDERMIRDKQFLEIFQGMASGVIFNWASDSCHSGDLTRSIGQAGVPLMTPKAFPMPEDVAWVVANNSKPMGMKASVQTLDVGYISGCKDSELSADTVLDGNPCGAFTHYLIEAIKQSPKGTTAEQLCKLVNQKLSSIGFQQRPQVEGKRAKMPFLGW